MKVRVLVLLVLVHVSLDLGSPWVAGAFTFDPDDSIDSASARRRVEAPPTGTTASVRPAAIPETVFPQRMEIGRQVEGWVAELRRAHGPSGEPPSPPSPDDH